MRTISVCCLLTLAIVIGSSSMTRTAVAQTGSSSSENENQSGAKASDAQVKRESKKSPKPQEAPSGTSAAPAAAREPSPEELARQREEEQRRKAEEQRRLEEERRRREEEARRQRELEAYQNKLKSAEQAVQDGNYLEARKIYEAMISGGGLTPAREKEVLEGFADANFRLMLSPQSMPESTEYTVKRGDSLYKIARKYGTTVGMLKRSNDLKGDLIYPDQKLKVLTEPLSIRVDKSENELFLYLDKKPVKRYEVATGSEDKTPMGDFKVTTKLENPVWYHAGAVVPPDSPDNILGTRWLGFDKPGYGIHGTTQPESIGKSVTSGCVRMRNEEVEELYALIPYGAEVTVEA